MRICGIAAIGAALAICIAIAVWGIIQYPGNRLIFCFFSFVIFAVTYFAIRQPTQYAHFFLGLAWFLGFWVKYLLHQATGGTYYEPHGSFDGSPANWDAVFLVIGIGGTGYLVGRLLTFPIANPLRDQLLKRNIIVPFWWKSYRNVIWLLAALLVFSVLAINQEFGLLVRGLAARVVLPWPLGGLFAWMTDIGLALLLAFLLAWDRQSGFGVFRGFIALSVEGALISISTLSRGVYFFHTVPPLLTESASAYRSGRFRPIAILLGMWLVIGAAVPLSATFLRLFGQNVVPATQTDLASSLTANIDRPQLDVGHGWNQLISMPQALLVDRWTGLEGVMATVAHPHKDSALLLEAATFHRSFGTVDTYTEKISGSNFTKANARKYEYATLAGPIAFLYFSGSLITVFLGMALISILMTAIETLWLWLARDRLLAAMSGLYLALIVLQLSGGLLQSAASLFAVTCAFGAGAMIQARCVTVSSQTNNVRFGS